MNTPLHPLAFEAFHCTNADTLKQTVAESLITHSIDLGRGFSVLHGTRDGLPIVIVGCQDQSPDELSAVWFAEAVA
jgi:hypothetical protein